MVLGTTAPLHAAQGGQATVAEGAAIFVRPWRQPLPGAAVSDGLGPLFNARSCAECHPAGGAAPLEVGGQGLVAGPGLVLRLADAGAYGQQLQTQAVPGVLAEGQLVREVDRLPTPLADGSTVTLQRPTYRVVGRGYGPLPKAATLSARLAPSLRGLGWVARLPRDRLDGRTAPTFGLRGEHESLTAAIVQALSRDLGLATPASPDPAGDCTPLQPACRQAAPVTIALPFVPAARLDALAAFVGSLRPLPRPEPASDEAQGAALMADLGCTACHKPTFTIDGDPATEGVAKVTIHPWSDFRVHALGAALADPVTPVGGEPELWRTAPLWGLGAKLRSGAPLLHDGRATDATQAILWHGGEALAARDGFAQLPAEDRAALLRFLLAL